MFNAGDQALMFIAVCHYLFCIEIYRLFSLFNIVIVPSRKHR